METVRVPSYKAIAIAILKNDHSLQSLGFNQNKSKFFDVIKNNKPKI
jgi:predicted phosphoadenosine phosphosulfate sulfurtransferase